MGFAVFFERHLPRPWIAGICATLLCGWIPASTVDARSPSAGRPGGTLVLTLREDPPEGFAIHESATIAGVWPAMPCFSNLVLFDPMEPVERPETIVGELAERWSWQDGFKNLVFFLRKGVSWHDGQPFTSRDVKFTFDVVREAPEAPARLRLNPRKGWYANVAAIETPDPHTVIFRLKRPQPSLLLMLAADYSPVYPAHVPPAELRTRCVGTGPFRLKEWRRGEFVDYVRNPSYFVPGRPYLDGLRYVVIADRGTRTAALQAGRVDVGFPGEGRKSIVDQVRASVPRLRVSVVGQNVFDNLLFNTRRPPLDRVEVRKALSLAVDRRAFVRAVHQGEAALGAAMAPPPQGIWGLFERDLTGLAGYGAPEADRAKAKALLATAGFTPANPLRIEVLTRAIAIYLDAASFVVSELRRVGVEPTLKQVDSAQWFPLLARREYQVAVNVTGVGLDDPDANFYENYACGSPRNYTDYCDAQVAALIDRQSQELDTRRRLQLVREIQRLLERDAARPILGWRTDHFVQAPEVRNLVPHQVEHNWGRMQEVWLDR
jgi:peptide/nickel transport system substrate-binding protein